MRKSQKILGQKKPSIAAAIWSGGSALVEFVNSGVRGRRTYRGREDDEARPVVLDELAHGVLYVYSSNCSPQPATPDLREEFNRLNYSGFDFKYNGSKNEGECGLGERSERYPNQRT